MEIEKKLYEAALQGNITLLNKLIQDDPLILDRNTTTFLQETPLHVAILRGHIEFSKEVLTHNPRLVSESDSLGHTPLHIASTKGDLEIIRVILSRVGANSCLAKSKTGYMPLHLAIMKGGQVEVIEELVRACPDSVRARVDSGDSALHLCVKFDNLDALQVIIKLSGNDGVDLLNAKNDDGNTILHLATLYKNFEMIKYLLSRPGIELNEMNNNGLTPLNLIENSPKDIKGLEIHNFLLQSNAQRSKSQSSLKSLDKISSNENPRQGFKPSWKTFFTFDNIRLEQHRGAILIIATILAATIALPVIDMDVNGPDLTDHLSTFSLTFVSAAAIIVLLVSGFSLRNKLCVWLVLQLMYTSIGFLGMNFIGSMISNENRYRDIDTLTLVTNFILFGLLLMLSVLNLIRLIVWLVVGFKSCVKKRRSRARGAGAGTGTDGLSNA